MRDDDATRPFPLPVLIQPDPMLEEHRAGSLRIAGTAIVAAAVVVLALYGMTRPAGQPEQMASAPEATQAEPAAAGSQGSTEPSTTGQGQPAANQPTPGKAERSDSAATGNASEPNDKPAPPAQ